MNEIIYFLIGLPVGVLLYRLFKPKGEYWRVTYELTTFHEDNTENTQKIDLVINTHPHELMKGLEETDKKHKKEETDGSIIHSTRALICCLPITKKQYDTYFMPDQ